jgi:PAS domain S-box-containing protein
MIRNGSKVPETILIVEDDEGLRRLIEKSLQREGFETDSAEKGAEAIERISSGSHALVLLDYQLPDMTGKQVVEKLADTQQQVPFVVMTGQGNERIAVDMMKLGACEYLVKDANLMNLLPQVVRRVFKEELTRRKLAATEAKLRELELAVFTLMSRLPGMVYRCRNDQLRTMDFVTEGCIELTGYYPVDLMGNKRIAYGQLIHEDDREMVWSNIQSALAERRPFELTYRLRSAKGEERWVLDKGSGLLSHEMGVKCLEGFVMDISERKRAEPGASKLS